MKAFSGCTETGSELIYFKECGHDVTTLGLKGTDIVCDIRDFHTTDHYNFMIFHPPCTEFSKANYRLGKFKDRRPDMTIVNACLRIIEESRPDYWILENPVGMLRHIIGMPTLTINYGEFGHYCKKPTDLWSNMLDMELLKSTNWIKNSSDFDRGPSSSKKRSMLPYDLSKAFCLEVEKRLDTNQYLYK